MGASGADLKNAHRGPSTKARVHEVLQQRQAGDNYLQRYAAKRPCQISKKFLRGCENGKTRQKQTKT
jgi:hypothetical protein